MARTSGMVRSWRTIVTDDMSLSLGFCGRVLTTLTPLGLRNVSQGAASVHLVRLWWISSRQAAIWISPSMYRTGGVIVLVMTKSTTWERWQRLCTVFKMVSMSFLWVSFLIQSKCGLVVNLPRDADLVPPLGLVAGSLHFEEYTRYSCQIYSLCCIWDAPQNFPVKEYSFSPAVKCLRR